MQQKKIYIYKAILHVGSVFNCVFSTWIIIKTFDKGIVNELVFILSPFAVFEEREFLDSSYLSCHHFILSVLYDDSIFAMKIASCNKQIK